MIRAMAPRPGPRYLPPMVFPALLRQSLVLGGLLLLGGGLPSCGGGAPPQAAPGPESPDVSERVRADSLRRPYTAADITFMSHMIGHHQQALLMAGWAPSHGARQDVAILCERIVVAQRDEIAMMQQWLSDRGLPVPDATSTRHRMKMNGIEHDMLMPGMLSDEEMAALDRARGAEFERLFLEGMIKHHQGAIDMVDVLFKAYGAAQDETIFKFANDVQSDQSIEIDVMRKMLEGK